jgi:hypothetical protein
VANVVSEQCPLCGRRKADGAKFCNIHNTALVNLETAYITWRKAFESLERDEYYSKLEKLPDTGAAVKEVIQHLRVKRAVE